MRERLTSGMVGLDRMLFGGIPAGNQIVLVGGPGSGKTLSCFEYLYKNALKGNSGLFISLEEKANSIIENASDAFTKFTDIARLIKEKKIVIYGEYSKKYKVDVDNESENAYEFSKIAFDIVSLIKAQKAKCLVVDSLSVIKSFIKDPYLYRALSISLASLIREYGITSMFTFELEEINPVRRIYPAEFFMYDGLIVYYPVFSSGTTIPSVEILKMRGSDHSYETLPYKITNSGIKILDTEKKAEE
jgi:circadian clock protein KaiC